MLSTSTIADLKTWARAWVTGALGVLLVGTLGSTASAGVSPIAVAPVIVRLDPVMDTAGVEVSNRGDVSWGVQVELLHVKWVDGKEEYAPAPDFVVSPPSFRLQPGKGRMVRFKYTGTRQSTEGFYRLFLRQLPEAKSEKEIGMVFNVGVPIFVAPTESRPMLTMTAAGASTAQLLNTGNVTLTVSKLEGKDCPPEALKVLSRIAPGQKLVVPGTVARCATDAQTDRGPMALTAR